jgi:adenylate cyclase
MGTFQDALSWLDARRTSRPGIAALRELLPGDSEFGDPLSTTRREPMDLVAQRAWGNNGNGRFSAARELGLAALQVADWLRPTRSGPSKATMAIVFTDLAGFSRWAVKAGDTHSLALLRAVDAVVTTEFQAYGGTVVKRLGDGMMAVFENPRDAAAACEEAIVAARRLREAGYRPRLRAGIHCGRAQSIGDDFIGVDVNIAYRLCEMAEVGQVVVSDAALENGLERPRARRLGGRDSMDGVPPSLEVFEYMGG